MPCPVYYSVLQAVKFWSSTTCTWDFTFSKWVVVNNNDIVE